MQRRSFIRYAATASAVLAAPVLRAQDKLVHIVIPYGPGGSTDIMTRLLTNSMTKTLGRTVIIDNKPGAAGLIAIRAIQNAPADGSMHVMVQNIGFVGLPYIQKVANYAIKDFTPICSICDGPGYIYIHSSVPAKNMAEFIAWAKAQPHAVESATSGPGGGSHTWTMLLAKNAGINLLPVPYKGGNEMWTAMMTGEAKVMVSTASEVLNAQVRAGNLRVIGVTSEKASSLSPGVPPVADTVPGFVIAGWFGFFGPGNMSKTDVDSFSNAVRIALAEPGIKEKYAQLYNEVKYEDPQAFAQSIRKTDEFYRRVVSELSIVPS